MDEVGKKDFLIRICCIIASFCLWIYISIINNPIKTVVVKNIQVQLLNTDSIKADKLAIDPNQQLTVNLTVKCNASKVIDLKASNFKVTADMSYYAIKQGKNRMPVEVQDTPSGVSVVKDESLWVDVEVDTLEAKVFPIQSKIEGKPEEGTYMNNPTIRPVEAEVTGPSKYLTKVEKVIVYGKVESFTSAKEVSLPLMAVDKSGNEIKEVSISPQTASVTLLISKIKTIPIKVVLEGKVSNNYVLDSVDNSVENVQITGEDSVLNSIESISTESIDINNLSDSKEVDAKLVLPQEVILVNSKNSVKIKLNVDKIDSKSLSCEIKGINLDNSLNYNFDPSTINILISGQSKKIKDISEKDITATVDLKGVNEGNTTLPVNVTVPPEINIVSKSTDTIKVIVTKK